MASSVVFKDVSDDHRKHAQYMHSFDNGYKVSVVFGCNLYCVPRCTSFSFNRQDCTCPKGDDFNIESYKMLEVAIIDPAGEFFNFDTPPDQTYHDVYGHQTREEVIAIIQRVREI